MITEKKIGSIGEFKVFTSDHAHQPRGNSSIPRINLTNSKIKELISSVDLKEGKNAIIWRHKTEENDYFKGMLVDKNSSKKSIIIVTVISNKKNKKQENLFKNIEHRNVL